MSLLLNLYSKLNECSKVILPFCNSFDLVTSLSKVLMLLLACSACNIDLPSSSVKVMKLRMAPMQLRNCRLMDVSLRSCDRLVKACDSSKRKRKQLMFRIPNLGRYNTQ